MTVVSKAEVLRVLRRAGYFEAADELAEGLPDPVDLDRDHDILSRHGITHDKLINSLGGTA